MSEFVIYHNPRCSKSRQTLALLTEHGIDPNIVLYLDSPPSSQDLAELCGQLSIEPAQLLRRSEPEYNELGLAAGDTTDQQRLEAMASHPRLIERPVVVRGDRAILGRPPENVLQLID